jgi:murein L,D-transpeptidase YafK
MFYFEDCADDGTNYVQVKDGGTIEIHGECNDFDCESEFDYGYVEKSGEKIYFVWDSLIPAILSDKVVYDCVFDRLLYRSSLLADLYSDKAILMNQRNCGNSMASNLQSWKVQLSSSNFYNLCRLSKNLDKLNSGAGCRIW